MPQARPPHHQLRAMPLPSQIILLGVLLLLSCPLWTVQACGVCILAIPPPSRQQPPLFVTAAVTRLAHHQPLILGVTLLVQRIWLQKQNQYISHHHHHIHYRYHHSKQRAWHLLPGSVRRLGMQELESEEDSAAADKENNEETSSKPPMTSAMVSSIGIYKRFISPLLPPACRFLPTCSQYGVQAIEEFGPTKGAILTAWRIMRCSPLGGKGYDPPRWPPVGYRYGSY